ncbi:MAG: hypothetical protein HZC37_26710 [Burkholderiales bacterium]|nr:hypothetical protein [Burkholderiales bacterium]
MSGRLQVARLQSRLDATFARAPAPSSDLEFQADFAKYLCVLVSGFLENAVAALILDYVERRSSPEVTLFVERQLKYWTNPNTDKIVSLLFSFSTEWGHKTGSYLVDARKESLNSLVALRHQIAHGESVGTSLYQVKVYYKTVREVVAFLTDMVDPT